MQVRRRERPPTDLGRLHRRPQAPAGAEEEQDEHAEEEEHIDGGRNQVRAGIESAAYHRPVRKSHQEERRTPGSPKAEPPAGSQ